MPPSWIPREADVMIYMQILLSFMTETMLNTKLLKISKKIFMNRKPRKLCRVGEKEMNVLFCNGCAYLCYHLSDKISEKCFLYPLLTAIG